MMGKVIMSGIVPEMEAPVGGILASDLAVGSSVYLMENGSAVEYLVVNQGKPSGSTLYDDSCDGTWLLRKNIYESRQWHSSNMNDYEGSTIHAYLNGTFFNVFDENVRNQIKQVKIPCVKVTVNGTTATDTVKTGANGLAAKVFLLSSCEAGITQEMYQYMNVDGASLAYFSGTAEEDSKRIGYLDGVATRWWFRSPTTYAVSGSIGAENDGGFYITNCSTANGVRPALVLPNNSMFDAETLVLKGVA